MKQTITLFFSMLLLAFTFSLKAQTLPCDNTCNPNAKLELEECGSGSNDVCENAELVSCGNIVCGNTYNGGVLSTFDTDWYKFTISQQQTLTFSLNGATSFFFSLIDNCTDQNIIDLMANQPCTESEIIVALQPGTYYINVFPNITGPGTWNCFNAEYYSFKITCEIEDPVCDLEVLTDFADPTCTGTGDDGFISLLIVNGQPLYDVLWDNGSTDQDLTFLTAGTYCYTVTDGLACTASGCVTLNAPSCGAPQNLSAALLSGTKATISWDVVPCAQKYRLQVRPLGTSTWNNYFINGFTNSKLLTGLSTGTTYQYRVRSVCSGDGSVLSPFSPIQTFSTSGCTAPFNPIANILSSSEVEILWGTVTGATKYRIRYRESGATVWTTSTVLHPQSSTVISGLTAATTYEFQMITVCGAANNLSSSTPNQTFTTNSLRNDVNIASNATVLLYPNPSSGLVNIVTTGIEGTGVIEVYDVIGKLIISEQVTLNHQTNVLNRNYSELIKGVYIVRLSANNKTYNIKFVKE